jgi:ADP-heptose:LPS heptosyltransferase
MSADNVEYLFSGTLGDAYIALCKIAARARCRPCLLRRLDRQPGIDPTIARVARLFPGVEYVEDYLHFETLEAMRHYAFASADRYINIFWDRDGRGNEPDDPPDLKFTAFPKFDLPRAALQGRRMRIGVQVHSGIRPDAPRVLSIPWIVELCRLLSAADLQLLLFGTGVVLSAEEHQALATLSNNCINLIGSTDLLEWLGCLRELNYLISIDGFAAYFALSQRVPTLVVFREREAVLRMAPPWRSIATCMWPRAIEQTRDGSRWVPLEPQLAASFLLAKLGANAL